MSCTDEGDVDKVTFPYTQLVGTYVVDMDLTQPFEVSEEHSILLSNTAAQEGDSLWLIDPDFFDSRVKVAWEGNTFSTTEGVDLINGEIVNVQGEVFPEQDSIHVEWRYLQGGAPEEDYIVIANGVLYNGITN
jgi:hypothetical protein